MISYDDFSKMHLQAGTIISAEDVLGSDKLLKLMVDLGEDTPRQILSGIKKWYQPSQLIGKQFVFITNLEPKVLMGLESQGMILCADAKTPIPLKPMTKVTPGTKIK